MLKIENFEVLGWEHAIRGMRNPMNSWEQSDSIFACNDLACECCDNFDKREWCSELNGWKCDYTAYEIGPNDLDLMKRLSKAGTDHRKFMRMLTVYVDITAPLYWWKEFDTYKVGTVANSCSTMHKIHDKEFTLEDFSFDEVLMEEEIYYDLDEVDREDEDYIDHTHFEIIAQHMVDVCEVLRKNHIHYSKRAKDPTFTESERKHYARVAKKYWRMLIQYMSISYNQKRTVMLNYEVLSNIYKSRRHHKLDEWHVLCDWVEKLPYAELITGADVNEGTGDMT